MVIFEIVFPVFAIAFGGYLAAYKRIVSARDTDGILRFVFYIALPIVLFTSLAHMELPSQINWKFFLSYYLVVVVIYAIGILVSRHYFSASLKEQGILGLGASYSNLVLVGLPIISAGFGDQGLLPLFMLVSIHSATLFFIATVFMERENGEITTTAGQIFMLTIKNLVRNPIIISLALGFAFNILKIPLAKLIDDTLGLVSKAAMPCALFVLGASLNQYKLTGHFVESLTMVGLKIVVQPFLVWILAFPVFHLDPLWGGVAVLSAGMPLGINTFVFAQKYQSGVAVISTGILLSSVLAILSQSFLLSLFI
jgi:malonate transporter